MRGRFGSTRRVSMCGVRCICFVFCFCFCFLKQVHSKNGCGSCNYRATNTARPAQYEAVNGEVVNDEVANGEVVAASVAGRDGIRDNCWKRASAIAAGTGRPR